jgi:hypothetical protein
VTSGAFRGIQSGDVNYRDVTVQPLDGVSAGTVVPWPTGVDNTGGGAGAGAPPNVACIFTLRTGLAGPSGRGRIYLPGVRVALMVDENTRWSLSDAGFAAAGQEFSDAVNAELDSGFLVVASYEHSTAAAVNSVQLRGYIGTQRRRAA